MSWYKDLKFAYVLAAVLLVVGVVSYAYTAFSAKPPDQPIRIMYISAAGKVLFDHKTHTADTGYGFSCFDCHHHPEGDDLALQACGSCHNPSKEAMLETCLECHDQDEIEDTEMANKADAFHMQCVECHQEVGHGPMDCSACHVL